MQMDDFSFSHLSKDFSYKLLLTYKFNYAYLLLAYLLLQNDVLRCTLRKIYLDMNPESENSDNIDEDGINYNLHMKRMTAQMTMIRR